MRSVCFAFTRTNSLKIKAWNNKKKEIGRKRNDSTDYRKSYSWKLFRELSQSRKNPIYWVTSARVYFRQAISPPHVRLATTFPIRPMEVDIHRWTFQHPTKTLRTNIRASIYIFTSLAVPVSHGIPINQDGKSLCTATIGKHLLEFTF